MGDLMVLTAAGVTATDRIVVGIGLVLIIAVALVVVSAYRATTARPPREMRLRRQWTVIRGGRRHEPDWRAKPSGRSGRRRDAGP